MTTATVFPADLLGKPAAGSWQGGPQGNVVAFQPSVGPPITRRRNTGKARVFSATWAALTGAQVVAFEEWFETFALDGSLPFAWYDPRTGDAGGYKIMPENPPYSINHVGPDQYDLSMSLMRVPGVPEYAAGAVFGTTDDTLLTLDFVTPEYLGIIDGNVVTESNLSFTLASGNITAIALPAINGPCVWLAKVEFTATPAGELLTLDSTVDSSELRMFFTGAGDLKINVADPDGTNLANINVPGANPVAGNVFRVAMVTNSDLTVAGAQLIQSTDTFTMVKVTNVDPADAQLTNLNRITVGNQTGSEAFDLQYFQVREIDVASATFNADLEALVRAIP